MGRKVANLGEKCGEIRGEIGESGESCGGVRGESSANFCGESRAGVEGRGESRVESSPKSGGEFLKSLESIESLARRLQAAENRALKALKIALLSLAAAAFLGILSLWVLLNQVTISAGIDKKLIAIERALGLEKVEKAEKTGD